MKTKFRDPLLQALHVISYVCEPDSNILEQSEYEQLRDPEKVVLQVRKLRFQHDALRKLCDVRATRIRNLENERESLREDVRKITREKDIARDYVSEGQDTITDYADTLRSLRLELSDVKAERQNLQTEVMHRNSANYDLRERITELETSAG